jgi:GNAT superfamily N-acetyltransferase
MAVSCQWRGDFENAELSRLHAEGFGHRQLDDDWRGQVRQHSLGWVCARQEGELAGFVNVAWDGGVHAFILDTLVTATARHHGIGTELIATAVRHARTAGCEWLHVDFEDHLSNFYCQACGFTRPGRAHGANSTSVALTTQDTSATPRIQSIPTGEAGGNAASSR